MLSRYDAIFLKHCYCSRPGCDHSGFSFWAEQLIWCRCLNPGFPLKQWNHRSVIRHRYFNHTWWIFDMNDINMFKETRFQKISQNYLNLMTCRDQFGLLCAYVCVRTCVRQKERKSWVKTTLISDECQVTAIARLPLQNECFKSWRIVREEINQLGANFNSCVPSGSFGMKHKTLSCRFPCEMCQFVRGMALKACYVICRTPLKKRSILRRVALRDSVFTLWTLSTSHF